MCMQFLFYRLDPAWRRLPTEERSCRTTEFAEAVETPGEITTYAYSTTGLKAGTDLMLWRYGPNMAELQSAAAALQRTTLGSYLEIVYSYIGLVRRSTYVRRQQPQEQAALLKDRGTYFIMYPFTKTHEWYQLGQSSRQGMMNEHIKVGHEHPDIRQVLVHSTGLDDQEFVVAYETENLEDFQSLVIALRSTDSRPYTLTDTPIFTCVHRPLREALDQLA